MAMQLPASSVVRFVGDLHLGDGGRNDAFGANDSLLVGFLRECESTCDAVVFMGDAFDLPQAWTVTRIVRAHESVMRAIESLASRIRVVFIRGNHDWNVDYPRLFDGAEACEELVVGGAMVCHGHRFDRYCHPDNRFHLQKVAIHNLAERAFGFEFRVPLADHDCWQNRVGHWLGHKYARYLRRMAGFYRLLGRPHKAERCEEFIHYWSRAVWGDPHALFKPAAEFTRGGPYEALLCGHTHLPGLVDLGGGHYINAGSWAFGAAEVATWNGTGFSVTDCKRETVVRDEHYRWMLGTPDPGDFFAWWKRNYRGWFRFDC
ncbi:MAG: UDP-2,3-diacylglucosamine diphosphatase [Candidatus Binatia bacterium]